MRAWLESGGMNPASLFGPKGSCKYQAMYYSGACGYDGYILSNKDETVIANMDLRFNGGTPQRNTMETYHRI
jgi:hypothetical protein